MQYPRLPLEDAVELLQAIGGLGYSLKKMCNSGPHKWALCQLTILSMFEYSEQPLVLGEHPGECLAKMWPELMKDGWRVIGRWNPRNYKGRKYVGPEL